MGKTRAELLAGMTQRELVEWMAFDELEPIGDLRADARSAIQTAQMVNLWAKDARAKPEDFMPWLPKDAPDEPDRDDPEEIEKARIRARFFKAALGAVKLAPGEKPPGWTGEIG